MLTSLGGIDLRLAVPAAGGWLAVGVLIALPDGIGPGVIAAWLLAAAAVAGALAKPAAIRWLGPAVVHAVVIALLLTCAAVQFAQRNPSALVDAADDGAALEVIVETAQAIHPDGMRGPLGVTVTRVLAAGATGPAGAAEAADGVGDNLRVPAVLFGAAPKHYGCCGIGTTLRVRVTLVPAEPGDAAAFLLFARGDPVLVAAPPSHLEWANVLRSGLSAAAASLPGDGGALLPGLAIGDTHAVDAGLDRAMKHTSLSHLTAVSGANCAVVVGLTMLCCAGLGMSRRWRIGVSLCVLGAFVVLVTPDPSVLRAAVMASIVLSALASGRPVRGVPVLSLAVVVLLALDPWLSRDPGFVLSVLATAGLVLLAGPITGWLSRWLPLWLAAVISIPLSAQLACQPVLILLNPALPVYGVIANLLSEAAAPIATVLGLLACAVLPVFEPLGSVLVALAWVPSAWIAAVARFFASLPGAQLPWVAGALGSALVAVLSICALGLMASRRATGSHGRRLLGVVLAAAVTCYAGVLAGDLVGRLVSMPGDWQIAACDVGQGDATIVRSEGEVALIDTGPDPMVLADCLDQLGIHRIQLLVLTHYDLDHVGGTEAVLGRVENAIVGPVADAGDSRIVVSLAESGAQVREGASGMWGLLGDLRWRVLWPIGRDGTGHGRESGFVAEGNDASVVMQFDGVGACADGCLSALLLGDLGEEAQARFSRHAAPGAVDVVKVAHHGSADQSGPLYERLRATLGIIGVGEGNRYGHPSDRLLAILAQAGTAASRTDRAGMVLVTPAGNGGLAVWEQNRSDEHEAPPVTGSH